MNRAANKRTVATLVSTEKSHGYHSSNAPSERTPTKLLWESDIATPFIKNGFPSSMIRTFGVILSKNTKDLNFKGFF